MSFADKARDWLGYMNWSEDDGFEVEDNAPDQLHDAFDKLGISAYDSLRGRFFYDALTVVAEQDLTPEQARAQAGHYFDGPLTELLGRYIRDMTKNRPEILEDFEEIESSGSLTETARSLMTSERQAFLRELADHYERTLAPEETNEVTNDG